MMVGVYRNP